MRLRRWSRFLGSVVGVCVVGASWLGCSEDKPSEVVPGVLTQMKVPRTLRTVRIDTQAQGEPSSCIIHSVDPSNDGYVTLPSTLGVVPGGANSRPVTITVTGYSDLEGSIPALQDCAVPPSLGGTYAQGVKLLRRIRMTYVDGRIVFVPMALRYACWNSDECAEDQTCIAGACTDATLASPSQLSDFNEALLDPGSSTCFNTELCLADQAPAKVVNADDCTYTFSNTPVGSGVNVRAYYDSGESEILDLDPVGTPPNLREGYSVTEGSPKTFTLAPGLCALVKAPSKSGRRIIAVDVASPCPSKSVLQPICGGRGKAAELAPAVSALYMLMDDSKSMAPLFGPDKVNKVLELSLEDPAFRTTSIAFSPLPHDPSNCTAVDNSAAKADPIPFGPAPVAREAVGEFVSDVTHTRSDDSPMYVDAALRSNGAYQAVRSFANGKGGAFNRLGVLLLLNRTISDDCASAPDLKKAADAAAEAFNPPSNSGLPRVYTYVVMMNNDSGPVDTTLAAQIAQSGGTTLFDARNDPATDGPAAFNAIVHDFGSCVYENTAQIDATGQVFYVNPLAGSVRVPVNHDEACDQGNGNGWGLDNQGRIRLCGTPCQDLRDVLTAASLAKPGAAPHVGVYGIQP